MVSRPITNNRPQRRPVRMPPRRTGRNRPERVKAVPERGFYGQETGQEGEPATTTLSPRINNPTTRKNLPRTMRSKQTLTGQVQQMLAEAEKAIGSLSTFSDPYSFQQEVTRLQAALEAQEKKLKEKSLQRVPLDYEAEEKTLQRLQSDYETVSSRVQELEEQRKELDDDATLLQNEVQSLEVTLRKKKATLQAKKRELMDVGKFQQDARKEGETVARNIAEAEDRLASLEKSMQERNDCLQLVNQCRRHLDETAQGIGALEQTFLASWRQWDHQQMIDWLCSQNDAYQEYRPIFETTFPKQVDDGADFEMFDKHVLLGMGVEKIRHRHDMMKSISLLISPGNTQAATPPLVQESRTPPSRPERQRQAPR